MVVPRVIVYKPRLGTHRQQGDGRDELHFFLHDGGVAWQCSFRLRCFVGGHYHHYSVGHGLALFVDDADLQAARLGSAQACAERPRKSGGDEEFFEDGHAE